jgi:response regulator of citrate/malate metabolism
MQDIHKTVLIVEDDEIDAIIHEMVINSIRFADNIIKYQSCGDAIGYLRSAAKGLVIVPELILLDLIMPLENGFEFLKEFELLPDELKNKTKIVVVTHSIDERDLLKSRENKNVSYLIEKPLTVEKLELMAEEIV